MLGGTHRERHRIEVYRSSAATGEGAIGVPVTCDLTVDDGSGDGRCMHSGNKFHKAVLVTTCSL